MIFYIATDPKGFRILKGTQAEAKAISKDFSQIDIPTDKAGLMAAIQELLTLADAATLNQNTAPSEIPQEPAPEPKTETLPVANPVEELLKFQQEVSDGWDNLPIGLRSDLVCRFMEDVRWTISSLSSSHQATTQETQP